MEECWIGSEVEDFVAEVEMRTLNWTEILAELSLERFGKEERIERKM